jgi:hypothetical protein
MKFCVIYITQKKSLNVFPYGPIRAPSTGQTFSAFPVSTFWSMMRLSNQEGQHEKGQIGLNYFSDRLAGFRAGSR